MEVDVYWNIRKRLFSVRCRQSRLVYAHTDLICIKDPKFVVQEGGRQRVLQTGRKNVHAFVSGALPAGAVLIGVLAPRDAVLADWRGSMFVTYDPYKNETFVRQASGKPVHASRGALLYIDNGRARIRVRGLR